ncbi:MAG: preprotein translocase subunit YajC [Acidimicrobiales bacterium]
MDLIIFPLLMAGMYLLLIRPQQKKLRAQRELIASVAVGDQVVSAGGIIGTVRVLTDDRLFLEVADGVELTILRGAISRKIDPVTAEVLEAEDAVERMDDEGTDDEGTDER